MNHIFTNKRLSYLGVFIFLISMYTIGTISAMLVSWSVTYILMVLSLGLLFLCSAARPAFRLSRIAASWGVFTAIAGFETFARGMSPVLFIFYISAFLLLFFSDSVDPDALYRSLGFIKGAGVFFALGCIWQYLFPQQYWQYLFPLFGEEYHRSIRRQFRFHKMCTGFTSQTAVAVHFITMGIMAAVYLHSQYKKRGKRINNLIALIIMIAGFILTGKRSPVLNIGITFILVDLLTVKRSRRANRIITIALIGLVLIMALFFLAPLMSDSRNAIVRWMETFTADGDHGISNGRFKLVSYAIDEFVRSPFIGIGWGKYGRIYYMAGVHNIYLQLLCECGLLLAFIAISMLAYPMFRSLRMMRRYLVSGDQRSIVLMKCSVFIQIYILLYGMFGNPLYDQNYVFMYVFGLLIASRLSFERGETALATASSDIMKESANETGSYAGETACGGMA